LTIRSSLLSQPASPGPPVEREEVVSFVR
jgi:hypothetical protein